jgi:hypothetical protein
LAHEAKPSGHVLPGWGGAATMIPHEASARIRNSDWNGTLHEPCEKTSSGHRPRATSVSASLDAAGNQIQVSRTRGRPSSRTAS